MRGLTAISSMSVRLIAETIVMGTGSDTGIASKVSEVGSTVGEYTYSIVVAGSGLAASSAVFGRLEYLAVDIGCYQPEVLVTGKRFHLEEVSATADGIARRLRIACRLALVLAFVVRH